MKTMNDLFYGLLQDVYFAEKELVKTLPKLANGSDSPELAEAFSDHLEQTKGHVERLEEAFKMIDMKPKAKRCDAILGIVAEGHEVMKEADDPDVRDAGVLAAAQAAEHYEIARYGTLCAWARQLGEDDVAELLHQTLEEEKEADEKLTAIADKSVNREAAAA